MSVTSPAATLHAVAPVAAPPPAVDRRGHVVELQSLRGVASLMVVAGHALGYYATPTWYDRPRNLANGHAAVVLFFVLSGYVLSLSLRGKTLTWTETIHFYVKRVFRIYPALWASSIVGLVYLLTLHYRVPAPDISPWFAARFLETRLDALHVTASFAGALAFLLPQTWTILTELVASAMLPFVAFALFRRRALFWTAFAVLLTFSLVFGERTYYAVGVYLIDFLMGAALCILPASVQIRLAQAGKRRAALALVAVGILVGAHAALPFDYNNAAIQIVEAGCAALLIAVLVYGGLQVPFLLWGPVRRLGDVSYSLYLVHFPLMCLLAKGLQLAAPGVEPALGGVWTGVLLCLATIALSLPAAWLSYTFVEKPGVRLGHFAWSRTGAAR